MKSNNDSDLRLQRMWGVRIAFDNVITRFYLAGKFNRGTYASCNHVLDRFDWPRLDLKTVRKTIAENIRIPIGAIHIHRNIYEN